MAKRKTTPRRSTSEKILIVLSIIIALSMILGLVVGLGGGRSRASSQTSQLAPDQPSLISWVVAPTWAPTTVAVLVEDMAPPGSLA